MPHPLTSSPKKIESSFLFHHFFGAYIVFTVTENANPGDFSIVRFNSDHIKKFERAEKYSISSFLNTVHVPLDDLNTIFYFPFGAKKDEAFIVTSPQFLINKRILPRLTSH